MGIFDSHTRTSVGTSVSKLIDTSKIVPSTKTALINAIFGDTGSITDHALDGLTSGLGIKAERMYDYASTKYTYGLPKANFISSASGEVAIKNRLTWLFGPDIAIKYYHVGAYNLMHHAYAYLVNNLAYESSTGEVNALTSEKGTKVSFVKLVVIVKEATLAEKANGSLDQWELDAPSFEVNPSISQDIAQLTYSWVEESKSNGSTIKLTKKATRDIPLAAVDTDIVQVKLSTGGNNKYFSYVIGSGSYPEVDAIFKPGYDGLGTFFPFTYFRYNKTSMKGLEGTDGYKTSEKMLKYLNIDYKTVLNSIHENPQINDVEQAMLVMAVPANSTDPVEQKYLFDFFTKAYNELGSGIVIGGSVGETDSISRARGNSTLSAEEVAISKAMGASVPKVSIVIRDNRFQMALAFQTITKQLTTGTIGEVGSYKAVVSTKDVAYSYTTRQYIGQGGKYELIPHTFTIPVPVHKYQKQIADYVYEEVIVYGLRLTYYIYDVFTTVGESSSDILLIPIDKSISETYSIGEREALYTRGLTFVFNSRVDTQVEWYQSADFMQFLFVVAAAMSLYDMGTTLASLSTMTLADFTMMVAMKLVTYAAISAGVGLFVKAVGAETAFIAAMIAAVYGGYEAIKAGGIKGSPFAKDLLDLASNINKGISVSIQKDFELLGKENEAFNTLAKEKDELLNKAKEELDQTSVLNPLVIFGETPSRLYDRTVHSGNIGVIGIDSVSSFVEVALTLPKINETLESNLYGTV